MWYVFRLHDGDAHAVPTFSTHIQVYSELLWPQGNTISVKPGSFVLEKVNFLLPAHFSSAFPSSVPSFTHRPIANLHTNSDGTLSPPLFRQDERLNFFEASERLLMMGEVLIG